MLTPEEYKWFYLTVQLRNQIDSSDMPMVTLIDPVLLLAADCSLVEATNSEKELAFKKALTEVIDTYKKEGLIA